MGRQKELGVARGLVDGLWLALGTAEITSFGWEVAVFHRFQLRPAISAGHDAFLAKTSLQDWTKALLQQARGPKMGQGL